MPIATTFEPSSLHLLRLPLSLNWAPLTIAILQVSGLRSLQEVLLPRPASVVT